MCLAGPSVWLMNMNLNKLQAVGPLISLSLRNLIDVTVYVYAKKGTWGVEAHTYLILSSPQCIASSCGSKEEEMSMLRNPSHSSEFPGLFECCCLA